MCCRIRTHGRGPGCLSHGWRARSHHRSFHCPGFRDGTRGVCYAPSSRQTPDPRGPVPAGRPTPPKQGGQKRWHLQPQPSHGGPALARHQPVVRGSALPLPSHMFRDTAFCPGLGKAGAITGQTSWDLSPDEPIHRKPGARHLLNWWQVGDSLQLRGMGRPPGPSVVWLLSLLMTPQTLQSIWTTWPRALAARVPAHGTQATLPATCLHTSGVNTIPKPRVLSLELTMLTA